MAEQRFLAVYLFFKNKNIEVILLDVWCVQHHTYTLPYPRAITIVLLNKNLSPTQYSFFFFGTIHAWIKFSLSEQHWCWECCLLCTVPIVELKDHLTTDKVTHEYPNLHAAMLLTWLSHMKIIAYPCSHITA